MDAGRSSRRVSRRVACLVAGLLCAVGVLSGAISHRGGVAHHRHPVVAMAFSAAASDSHGGSARGDLHAVAAGSTSTQTVRWIGVDTTAATGARGVSIDTVRTRGPPGRA
jgi:hypothetical protein